MLEWLKEILGDGYTEDVDSKVSQAIGKNFVAKTDFNAVNLAKKEAERKLGEAAASTDDIAILKQQIATLQAQNANDKKTYEADLARIRMDHAVESALTSAGARNNIAAKALLADFLKGAKLEENGTVKGLSDEIERMAKSDETAFLFKADENGKTGTQQFKGMQPGSVGGKAAPAQDMTLADLRKMTPADRYKYSVDNPERYKELYGGN